MGETRARWDQDKLQENVCRGGHVVPIETQSPVPVSRKWEYSGVRPETFGVFALKG
jgi:hypothetical protein